MTLFDYMLFVEYKYFIKIHYEKICLKLRMVLLAFPSDMFMGLKTHDKHFSDNGEFK